LAAWSWTSTTGTAPGHCNSGDGSARANAGWRNPRSAIERADHVCVSSIHGWLGHRRVIPLGAARRRQSDQKTGDGTQDIPPQSTTPQVQIAQALYDDEQYGGAGSPPYYELQSEDSQTMGCFQNCDSGGNGGLSSDYAYYPV
ncbi:MAG TPA: hypothetical protein VG815_01340, partial [Chloroflexota bacterium]|nr:hypothetical protein [Chloroflexota bacterium]